VKRNNSRTVDETPREKLNVSGQLAACLTSRCRQDSVTITALELIGQPGFSFKIVLNETAAVFLRADDQRRNFRVAGVSCEDDHTGNALAATVSKERIDIRYHSGFLDERVRRLAGALLSDPRVGLHPGHKSLLTRPGAGRAVTRRTGICG